MSPVWIAFFVGMSILILGLLEDDVSERIMRNASVPDKPLPTGTALRQYKSYQVLPSKPWPRR